MRIDPITQHLAASKHDLAVLPEIVRAYGPLSGEIREAEIFRFAERPRELARKVDGKWSEQPRKLLEEDAQALHDLATRIAAFRARLLPSSFLMIFATLLIITLASIILPLAVLPGIPYPAIYEKKKILLGGFILGLAIFLGFFGVILWRLYRLRLFTWP